MTPEDDHRATTPPADGPFDVGAWLAARLGRRRTDLVLMSQPRAVGAFGYYQGGGVRIGVFFGRRGPVPGEAHSRWLLQADIPDRGFVQVEVDDRRPLVW